ncbi:phospholipase D-like domain-containing protein [Pontibacter litorisediminis]|uniref:phospholipase D-like domain-containing protein n=1 Tax=Pontibacter litorisediminis TaxID=1846260 RepID=UPI0023EE074F|nr:phospholipase D-like domain-containing protein [Pontibacter litorisediminis]
MQGHQQKITSHAFFSPGDECLNAIVECMDEAEESIKICVFTISDNRITEAIIRAYKRGVSIRIITDNKKLHDTGSDIRELAVRGLEVRIDKTRSHMHHKFAVFDEARVLTGSYNWTRSAALYNHENILVTDNHSIVQDYSREFDRLWQEMMKYNPGEKYKEMYGEEEE